ncbi:MAG: hypothetical protein KGJ13_01665 [Patescibacteria group bacterium]|nr:hypothetical protein [Patescibacteria group bacterium]
MAEKFEFNPEDAAFRAELIGNLKIDVQSYESKRLLESWAIKGEQLVESGAIDTFQWHQESADMYREAGLIEGAIWVLKQAAVEARQLGREDLSKEFQRQLVDLGADPDDLNDIYDFHGGP